MPDLFGLSARLKGPSRVTVNGSLRAHGRRSGELDELRRFVIDGTFLLSGLTERLQGFHEMLVPHR